LVTFLWLLTGVALVLALAAWTKSRRLAKRLERLSESYWELRYEHGQLRARVNRIDSQDTPAPESALPAGTSAFVPLSSLKR
jgi:hypothetical protein